MTGSQRDHRSQLVRAAAGRFHRRMRRPWRRVRANLYYIGEPLRDFIPVLGLALALVLLGGLAFHELYLQRELTFAQGLYYTYSLLFMEHLLEYPKHWLLQLLSFALPVVGLVVILDGLVRFGYHILRRDETGKKWIHAMTRTLNQHVILFGLGKVGFRVLQQLMLLGEQVVIVEKDAHCENLAFARRHSVPVLIGTGREEGILESVNLKDAKSLILCTDDDLANLELALDARNTKPSIRIVLRMYDQELASKVKESFGIHVAFSTSELCAPLFATASSDHTILNAFYAGDLLLVVARLDVGPHSQLVGRLAGDLCEELQAFLVSLERDGRSVFHPDATVEIRADDRLTVQCQPATLKSLHALNRNQTARV